MFATSNRTVSIVALLFAFSSIAFSQEFKAVHDGVEYAEITKVISGQPVRMNLLRLDLRKVRLDLVHASDSAIGTETTSSIAKRKNAIAAINSGFFRLDKSEFAGDAAGIFQIDGKLLSESNNGRTALLINNSVNDCLKCRRPKHKSDVSIEHLNTFAEFWSAATRSNISGIDRQRKENES